MSVLILQRVKIPEVRTLTAHGAFLERAFLLEPRENAMLLWVSCSPVQALAFAYHVEGVVALAEDYTLLTSTWKKAGGNLRSGHSSPGNLHLEQVLSYGFRQIPQTSSSGISQAQAATAFHSRIVTFIAVCRCSKLLSAHSRRDENKQRRLNRGKMACQACQSCWTLALAAPPLSPHKGSQCRLRLTTFGLETDKPISRRCHDVEYSPSTKAQLMLLAEN